jgi:hypothetical protein
VNQPYRVPAKRKKKRKAARELVYSPGDQEKRVTPARAALQIFIVGSIIGSLLVLAGWVIAGILVFGVSLLLAYRSSKKPSVSSGAVLSVEKGRLKVYSGNALEPRLTIALDEVREVTLDTRSIQRGGADIGALAGLGGGGGGTGVDLARIAIVVESEPLPRSTPLTDEYFPRMDCVEWMGKVRTFLRSHRWLPEDERAAREDEPDEADASP